VPKGILYVESRPKDPARLDEYHEWYDGLHLHELVDVVGFVSARRFEPVGDDGPFVAILEFDDDLDAVQARVANARSTGNLSESQAEVLSARFFTERASYQPGAAS
jgi:hypothetical protein